MTQLPGMFASTRDATGIIGHRAGAGEAPENTVAGLRHCHKSGCVFAQVEVIAAKDGTPMVMQKPNDLKRLTGLARPVSECLPKDIPPLLPQIAWYMPGIEDVKFDTSSYGPEGRTIPTLKGFLTTAKQLGQPCFVEPFTNSRDFVFRVAEDIKETGTEGIVVFGHPFSSSVQSMCEQALPGVPVLMTTSQAILLGIRYRLGLLSPSGVPKGRVLNTMMSNDAFEKLLRAGNIPWKVGILLRVFLLCVEWFVWRPDFIEFLHRNGIPTVAFVLNEDAEWKRAVDLGISCIMTDFPGHCRESLLAAHGASR